MQFAYLMQIPVNASLLQENRRYLCIILQRLLISCIMLGSVHIPEHTRSLSGSLLGYKTIP